MDNTEQTINTNGRFLSTDCDDFWLDEPGDHTVRPCRPSLLEHAKAERAKIMAAQAANGQQGDEAHAEKPLS
jgi:hypothetical protein